MGLSPRVRGNLRPKRRMGAPPRSIPACAGEPFCESVIAQPGGVYPRVCGGTSTDRWGVISGNGLSPRVRGNQWRVPSLTSLVGSIPACAGEPVSPTLMSVLAGVYPRVCGGTGKGAGTRAAKRGLSPRVRGNPSDTRPNVRSIGSIPACAGEPAGPSGAAPRRRVYPRVCGGTAGDTIEPGKIQGLSPRVRGNPVVAHAPLQRQGSIPACAGEPRTPTTWRYSMRVYPRVCGGTIGWQPK